MPDTTDHPLRNALAKFWAPVPWLLEASIVLELTLHKYYEAGVIAALLVFNAALAYFQESRAQATLAAREHAAEGSAQDRTQPGDLQWCRNSCHGRICLYPCDAVERDRSSVTHVDFGRNPRGIARDLHPGARSLAKLGVLPTRLSAVDEAASIDVLCSDKTGTLTRNELSVTSVRSLPGFDEAHVLGLAALASSEGGQDPVDEAIRAVASQKPAADLPKLATFLPFDPRKKTSEATATDATGVAQRILKGAFAAVVALTAPSPATAAITDELEKQGFRVLAVAAGIPASLKVIGLIALSDPPRADSVSLISELHTLGVRTVMVTEDAPVTAAIVAHAVGLNGAVCPPGKLPDAVKPEEFAVFAGTLPEGKYDLVKAFQKNGHTVGMCGDGANDAPALRQAQLGILSRQQRMWPNPQPVLC
jgi:magnesium-transporting ATPase (P-type)